MTESEKAQAYDKAVERARQFIEHPLNEDSKNVATYILYGEEDMDDERIRKEIHIYLDWLEGRKECAPKGEYTIKEMIAWLEKQGEQKPIEVVAKEVIKDKESAICFLKLAGIMDENGNLAEVYRAEEKEPVACSEDEKVIYDAIREVCNVEDARAFAEHNQTLFNVAKRVVAKYDGKKQWKPTADQLKALNIAINVGINPSNWEGDALRSLRDQLKGL